jgi:hypothetical protein
VRIGKTPILSAEEARQLLDSIDTSTVVRLRDRALIALLVYTFARFGAALGIKSMSAMSIGSSVGSGFASRKKVVKSTPCPATITSRAICRTISTPPVLRASAREQFLGRRSEGRECSRSAV